MATIEVSAHGTTFAGREAVEVFRLNTLISALKAHKIGLRLSRNVSALKVAKQTTGLKSNDCDVQIVAVQKLLETARAAVTVVRS